MIATLLLSLFQAGSDGQVTTQQLLDMAPPGAVIRSQAQFERLTIRKPVTLIGGGDFGPSYHESITLDGPGAGKVSIVAFNVTAIIKGGGFDELRLERVGAFCPVELEDLNYLEADPGSQFSATVSAPGATFVSAATFHGQADPAVRCHALYTVGRFPLLVDVTERHIMPHDLLVSSPARPGGSIDLDWRTPGPIGFLYMAEGTRSPTPMPGANFGFNHLGSWLDVQLVAVAPCSTSDSNPGHHTFDIPPGYALIGRQFAFQVYDPPAYYSSPAFVTVR